jgi:hypothetical protein
VPSDYKSLIALPGVGPKIAKNLQREFFGKGIGISEGVHRVASRLEWVGRELQIEYDNGDQESDWKPSKTPIGSAAQLEEWLPSGMHPMVVPVLGTFASTICTPTP